VEAISQAVKKELQSSVSSDWSLFSVVFHNNKKSIQLASFCLLVFLIFGLIVYDGNFINNDPPVHISQSWTVLIRHCIETSLIKCFGETVNLSIIDKFKLLARAPPA